MIQVKLLTHTPTPEKVCAVAAKTCYAPGMPDINQITPDNALPILRKVIDSGHHSILEHAVFTFSVEGISRACSHQLVRHRVASYAQQSQRYVTQKERFAAVVPASVKNAGFGPTFEQVVDYIHGFYAEMVQAGVPAEDARFVLPNAAETKIVMTMNARELRHFFALRCCRRAQWEIRAMALQMLHLAYTACPLLFRGVGPACMTGSCPEGQMSCGQPFTLEEL